MSVTWMTVKNIVPNFSTLESATLHKKINFHRSGGLQVGDGCGGRRQYPREDSFPGAGVGMESLSKMCRRLQENDLFLNTSQWWSLKRFNAHVGPTKSCCWGASERHTPTLASAGRDIR